MHPFEKKSGEKIKSKEKLKLKVKLTKRFRFRLHISNDVSKQLALVVFLLIFSDRVFK